MNVTFLCQRIQSSDGFSLCLFLCLTGIDLAFIENGFIYHTKYDTADRILTDSIQRAGMQISPHASTYTYVYVYLFCKYIRRMLADGCVCLSQGGTGHCSS